ncbi:unnamed protein product [Didymodactylos carnosus]|uniref:Uncharacterized protein n=1 Tax=Didymodactylos carnosus TaxID=1234261 RepID=A0A814MU37_9BILA|nr:unnamed protein product [Didymodactylos carnosus]CAF3847063.1 unnamed protein product [Didymodactylos carnosus]
MGHGSLLKNFLIQIAILGAQVIGRAFSKALRQELQYSQTATQSGKTTARTVQADRVAGMSLQEAKQILNISAEESIDVEKLKAKYDYLFKINDKTKGGSFYLQSKIYRANERIEQELKSREREEEEGISKNRKKTKETTKTNDSAD